MEEEDPLHALKEFEALLDGKDEFNDEDIACLLYTSPSPRDA